MLERLNNLLGITEENPNPYTEFALEDAKNKVLNYCNIEEIPQQLETTVIRLAMDIFRGGGYGEETVTGQVVSVKRGDTSTTFADTSKSEAIDTDYISKYRAILNSYRKLRW